MPFKKAEQGKGLTVIYYDSAGKRVIQSGGSRAWRNHNLGNLACSPFSKRHGAIGCDHKTIDGLVSESAIFPDNQTGDAAYEALLKGESYRNQSMAEVITHYAPKKGGNDPEKYIKSVTKDTGLSGDRKVSSMNTEEFQRLFKAMKKFEGWKEGTVSRPPDRRDEPRNRTTLQPQHQSGKQSGIENIPRNLFMRKYNCGIPELAIRHGAAQETLKREGEQVYRAKSDGGTRGSFTSR